MAGGGSPVQEQLSGSCGFVVRGLISGLGLKITFNSIKIVYVCLKTLTQHEIFKKREVKIPPL